MENKINKGLTVEEHEALKQRFVDIFTTKIKREGADKILAYLTSSHCDFFDAPASTKHHGSYPGGLLQHSLNVYDCLVDILSRERYKSVYGIAYSEESIAIASLLHDICKTNFYVKDTRNVKVDGKWETIPCYSIEDTLPYGHGEKSVYIISGFMKLTRDEAFAIRWHMGFSDTDNKNAVGQAFTMFPLAFALSTADMEATYYLEKNN